MLQQSYIHHQFEQSANQLHQKQNNDKHKHDEFYKNNQTQQHEQQSCL